MEPIQLNEPRTLLLSANDIANVLDGLAELPFKRSNPTIQSIFNQLRKSNEQSSSGGPQPAAE